MKLDNAYSKINRNPLLTIDQTTFKGSPYEVKRENFNFINGIQEYEGYVLWKFDKENKLIHSSFQINNSGDKYLFFYKESKLILKEWFNSVTDSLYTTTKYTYNTNQNIEKIETFNASNDLMNYTEYYYDQEDNNYPNKVKEYGSWSSTNDRDIYLRTTKHIEYDDNYNIIKIYSYNENEEQPFVLKFEYDENNNLIGEGPCYDNESVLMNYFVYVRDEKGKIIERYYVMKDSKKIQRKCFYQNDDLIFMEIYDETCNIASEEEFKFNLYRDIIYKKQTIKRQDNIQLDNFKISEASYEIEYDSIGNILKKKSYSNSLPTTLNIYTYFF